MNVYPKICYIPIITDKADPADKLDPIPYIFIENQGIENVVCKINDDIFFGVYVKLKKVIASSPENFTSRKSRHYILLNRNKISE